MKKHVYKIERIKPYRQIIKDIFCESYDLFIYSLKRTQHKNALDILCKCVYLFWLLLIKNKLFV